MKKDRALTAEAHRYGALVEPHLPVVLPGQPSRGIEMARLLLLTGLRRAAQVTLGIANIRARYPQYPLVTFRWKQDRRVVLYAFDSREEAVLAWKLDRLQIVYTITSRTWSGAIYPAIQALSDREKASIALDFRHFLERLENIAQQPLGAPLRVP